MARRADDLLSIFDPNRSDGEGGGAKRKRSARRKSAASKKRGFQGLYLTAKQVWLGGSAALLLLLLTFVLGLAVGRPGGDPSDNARALSRVTPKPADYVMLRADFPRQNPNTQKPISRRAVYTMLVDQFEVPGTAIVDIRVDGENMVVELGPFANRSDAEGWVQKWKLPSARINMAAPFRYHEVVAYVKPKR